MGGEEKEEERKKEKEDKKQYQRSRGTPKENHTKAPLERRGTSQSPVLEEEGDGDEDEKNETNEDYEDDLWFILSTPSRWTTKQIA